MSSDHDDAPAISKAFLRRVHELAGVGTFVADPAGGTIFISAEMAHLLRAGREAFVMDALEFIHRFVHPDDRDSLLAEAAKRGTTGSDFHAEFRYVRGDGEVVWVTATSHLEPDENGEPAIVGVVQDVTSRKRSEERLRESEARFRAFSERALVGVSILEDGRYSYVNPALERMFGYEHGELLGVDPITTLTHPDDRAAVAETVRQRYAGAQPTTPYEVRGIRKDGSRVNVAIFGATVEIEGRATIIGNTLDVTERTRAEERLHESEARFRTLSENALVGVYVMEDGAFSYVNPSIERVFGYEQGELVGVDPITLVHPDDRALAAEGIRKRTAGEASSARYEIRGIRKDGSGVDLEVFGTVVDVGGRSTIIGNLLDVTERKRAENALRESELQLRQSQKMEAIGALAGGVAHDFNNLLTVIMSSASMLSFEMGPGDGRLAALEQIEAAAERAASLTKQLLAFSRKQEQHLRTVDLNASVAQTAKMLGHLLGADVELTTVPSEEPAWVLVDPGQIEQVLMNLAINARDAMPSGGKLDIEIGRAELVDPEAARLDLPPGAHAMIRVTDTGIGMDAETQQRIFEPFFTTKEIGKGTGLGLSTVFGIVQQNQGRISVESTPGHGTTFRIWFPLATETNVSEKPRSFEDLRGTETVLLVEDDAQVRKVACTLLTRNGYRVLEAAGGGDALLLCEEYEGTIDVVLTDLLMPRLRGDRLVARLARLRPRLKAVYMSGYPGKDDGHEEGFVPGVFVEKPFTPEALLRGLREALAA